MASLLVLTGLSAGAQTWNRLQTETSGRPQGHFDTYQTDVSALEALLAKAAPEQGLRKAGVATVATLSLPNPEGKLTPFFLEETQLLQLTDGASVPVHTYNGYSMDKSEQIHLTSYAGKLYGIVLRGGYTWYISTPEQEAKPASALKRINIFDDAGRPDDAELPAACSNRDGQDKPLRAPDLTDQHTGAKPTATPSVSCALKTYRLAVGCPAEFTVASGSQANAIANLTALINNVNAIFERDFGIRFTVVTNNNLICTDTATDPFNPALGTSPQLNLSANAFTTHLGSAAYDAGITIFYTNFGGLAYLSSTCSSAQKGKAVAGYNSLDPTSYLRTVTTHELGHVFNATHSFNANAGSCASSISLPSAWEVGGGATVMSYTNCTPSYSISNTTYFHGGNIGQVKTYLGTTNAGCFVSGAVNTTPAITTPTNDTFFIPVSTPYRLYANATDAEDPNTLLYTFDQMDPGKGSSSLPATTDTIGPLVRPLDPTALPYRYVPQIKSLRDNTPTPYEVLASVPRKLSYWATVRDNHIGCGCTARDTILIKTTGTAAFRVTSQNTSTTMTAGSSQTVTWNVAGTSSAPVNAANVQILFAADGLNYSTVLRASTPNNGSATVTIPNIMTSQGRIMVAAIGNLFFNINSANITVQPACTGVQQSSIWPQDPVTACLSNLPTVLKLHPIYGKGIDTLGGEISTTDPTGVIGFRNGPGATTCRTHAGWSGRYDVYRFRVGQPGAYNVSVTPYTLPAGFIFMTTYGSGGLTATAAGACNNYRYSSTNFVDGTSSSINTPPDNFTFTTQADSVYTLALLKYGSTNNLGTYRININGPAQVYPEQQTPTGSYTYLLVNNAGVLVAINATSSALFTGITSPASPYTVYGLNYSTGLNLNTYLNQPFTNLQNASFGTSQCASISSNFVKVTVIPCSPKAKTGSDISEESDPFRGPGMTLVPNPATSKVTFRTDHALPLQASLTDMSGKLIKRLVIDHNDYVIDIAHLSPGMYLLSGKGFALKLIKQ